MAQADESAALNHLLQAAELGHRPAWRVLGFLYALEATTASQERATCCFARAAVQGDAHAEYMLGLRYLQGLGVAADVDEACYWLASAANKQIYSAAGRLRLLVDELGEPWVQRNLRERMPQAKQLARRSLDVVMPDICPAISHENCPLPTPLVSSRTSPTVNCVIIWSTWLLRVYSLLEFWIPAAVGPCSRICVPAVP